MSRQKSPMELSILVEETQRLISLAIQNIDMLEIRRLANSLLKEPYLGMFARAKMNYYAAISWADNVNDWDRTCDHLDDCISRCNLLLRDEHLHGMFPSISRFLTLASQLLHQIMRHKLEAIAIHTMERATRLTVMDQELSTGQDENFGIPNMHFPEEFFSATDHVMPAVYYTGNFVPATNSRYRNVYPVEDIVAMIDFGVPNMYYVEEIAVATDFGIPNMYYVEPDTHIGGDNKMTFDRTMLNIASVVDFDSHTEDAHQSGSDGPSAGSIRRIREDAIFIRTMETGWVAQDRRRHNREEFLALVYHNYG